MTRPAVTMPGQMELAANNADDWWWSCAWAGLEQLASHQVAFQAFDLIELGVPEPDHPNRWGPLFATAAQAGLIVRLGYAPSKRPTVRGSAAAVWRGTGRQTPASHPPAPRRRRTHTGGQHG